MSRKKPHKPQDKLHPGISWREALAIFASITGLISSVLAWLDIVQYGQMGYQNFLWAGIVAFIVIWGIILWLLYKQKNIYLNIWLAVTIIIAIAGGIGWASSKRAEEERIKAIEEKVIVLVTKFDGPEDEYGLRDELIEQLREDTKDYKDTEIIAAQELVAVEQGSDYARNLGEKYHADFVIWAWYRPTDNPNITIHIENLSTNYFSGLQRENAYQPDATIAGLRSFDIQEKIGSEMSSLISFVSGYVSFKSEDYPEAIYKFKAAILENDKRPFVEKEDIFFLIGLSYWYMGDYDGTIKLNSMVIELDPFYRDAYTNRGIAYGMIGENQRAIDDATKAIELGGNYEIAYMNRGIAYLNMDQYDNAIEDLNKAISINPDFAEAYNNRGVIFTNTKQFENAIENYTKAIELKNGYIQAYLNRGEAYANLGQFKKTNQDANQVIKMDPSNAYGYHLRGVAYFGLNQLPKAIDSFNKAIELNPNIDGFYRTRGIAYETMNNASAAEADFAKYKELTGEDVP